jgi:hypothetical protein
VADTIQPPGGPQTARAVGRSGIKSLAGSFFALRAADVQLYRICDDLSGLIIFPMLVFGPWAFGTTQPWSIWTMNIAGYALGILLLAKATRCCVGKIIRFTPPRKPGSGIRWRVC